MKYLLIFLLFVSFSIAAMKRSPALSTIDELVVLQIAALTPTKLDQFVAQKGGISKLSKAELKGFIRNKGSIGRLDKDDLTEVIRMKVGFSGLNEDKLDALIRRRGGYRKLTGDEFQIVTLIKFILKPEKQEPLVEARTQRLKREKQKKLEAMKKWSKTQVIDYINAKPADEKLDCDALNILNDILEGKDQNLTSSQKKPDVLESHDQPPLTASKKKLLQEKFVKFIPGQNRWPDIDFTLLNQEELEKYTNSFSLTETEAEFISQRQTELLQLQSIDQWDKDKAIAFINNLLNKESITYAQWKKISCAVGLPLVQLKPMIKPMSARQKQEFLDAHNKELAEREQLQNSNKSFKIALDDNGA